MALRALPADARARLTRRRRARAIAGGLAAAGAVCLGLGVRADPTAAAARARSTPPALGTALWSPRRAPAVFVDAVATARLRARLATVVGPLDACIEVRARSGSLVQIGAGRALAAASTQKLLVAAAALSRLGPQYRFATRAVSDASFRGGVLGGDLVVIGGGDPVLTTHTAPTAPATHLTELADAIAAAGVARIDGALVADDSRYDRRRAVPDWTPSEISEGDVGALGALVVDGGYEPGRRAPASDPGVTVVQQLAQLLETRGVAIAGGTRDASTATSERAPDIARIESPPLAAIVESMLTTSNNETAELLTRELGVARDQAGTTATGTTAVRNELAKRGVPMAGVALHDGSGLAPDDRVTCAALLGVMDLSTQPRFAAIDAGLPVAGRTGTLAGRFLGSSLAGRLRAKTGHIHGVVGLAGVVDGPDRPRFAFAANGDFSTAAGEQLQDEIAEAIGAYPDSPGPEALVPRPVASEPVASKRPTRRDS